MKESRPLKNSFVTIAGSLPMSAFGSDRAATDWQPFWWLTTRSAALFRATKASCFSSSSRPRCWPGKGRRNEAKCVVGSRIDHSSADTPDSAMIAHPRSLAAPTNNRAASYSAWMPRPPAEQKLRSDCNAEFASSVSVHEGGFKPKKAAWELLRAA